MQVSTILESIDLGAIALPEFQRGYVWNRKQVRDFMHSLYRKRPVGSLLMWVTPSEGAPTRGDGYLQPGHVKLLVDEEGQLLAIIDLAWPNGVQEGLADPVAVLLGEGDDIEDLLDQAGYRYFTTCDSFYRYVNQEILAISEEVYGD